MFKQIFSKLSALLIAALLSIGVVAQSSQEAQVDNTQQKQNVAPAKSNEPAKANEPPKAPAPEYVDFSGFKGKIIEVKHRSPRDLASIVTPLGSGFKGARIVANSQPPSISIRDFPENIAAIEEAIKRLDVPLPPKPPEPPTPSTPPPPDVEIYGYLLIATQTDEGGNNYPKAIDDVVKQLQANLAFKSYRLLTSIVQRTRLYGRVSSRGIAALPDKSVVANYNFGISRITPSDRREAADFTSLDLDSVALQLQGLAADGQSLGGVGQADINTNLKIRTGEKVVVGTTSLRDKALILVLTVKVLK